tara:strand:+ start:22037 stop:22909 length:873 start_codon:yes stop_codon:yes gene_type:complete
VGYMPINKKHIISIRAAVKSVLAETRVLGYIKPTKSFFTLKEWDVFVTKMLRLQKKGFDTRGGEKSCKHPKICSREDYNEFISLIAQYFGFQMNTEVKRYDLLTYKNILDFIEDFVNHRFWAIEKEFGHYFKDISKLKIAYFYSRGDLEPYALIDEELTYQLYGSTWNPKTMLHYTTKAGIDRIQSAISSGSGFDISSFTVAERDFFRKESIYIIKFIGNVRAGFRSDIKSFATDSGRRAVNLYRLEYPGKDLNNICYELETCDGSTRTSLWNEYISTPLKIIDIKKIKN